MASLVMLVLSGASVAIARVSEATGAVRQFETTALIPAIAVLIIVMAGYLIRGRSAGQPMVLTHLKWKYRVLTIAAIARLVSMDR